MPRSGRNRGCRRGWADYRQSAQKPAVQDRHRDAQTRLRSTWRRATSRTPGPVMATIVPCHGPVLETWRYLHRKSGKCRGGRAGPGVACPGRVRATAPCDFRNTGHPEHRPSGTPAIRNTGLLEHRPSGTLGE
ncbi:hypothetical protein YT1_3448 [Rhodococcus ruber]|nr:hypothetical protein YT1_3448 [Rhodococcus ruber]